MRKELWIAAFSFGLFVVCPRMAGMIQVIGKHSSVSLWVTVLLGTAVSLPILMLMVFIFSRWGIWGALGLCVLTDFGAALLMKEISFKAGVETLIIAFFVILGVKIAPLLTQWIGPKN